MVLHLYFNILTEDTFFWKLFGTHEYFYEYVQTKRCLQDMRFTHWCYWIFKSSGMGHCHLV